MKKEREKSTTSKGSAVTLFFKKNMYIILMIVCILAIATMITVAAVMNNKKDIEKPIANVPKDEKPVDKPDDPNKPVDKPDPEVPVVKPFEFLLRAPLASVTYGNVYSDSVMVGYNDGSYHTHNGLDIMAAAGSTVVNGLEGKVVSIENDTFEMTVVTIEHKEGYKTVYKLLEGVTLKVGDNIATGATLGVVSGNINHFEGNSAAHLHLEVLKNGVFLNPQTYMMEGNK